VGSPPAAAVSVSGQDAGTVLLLQDKSHGLPHPAAPSVDQLLSLVLGSMWRELHTIRLPGIMWELVVTGPRAPDEHDSLLAAAGWGLGGRVQALTTSEGVRATAVCTCYNQLFTCPGPDYTRVPPFGTRCVCHPQVCMQWAVSLGAVSAGAPPLCHLLVWCVMTAGATASSCKGDWCDGQHLQPYYMCGSRQA
jgi:hypothetical protein